MPRMRPMRTTTKNKSLSERADAYINRKACRDGWNFQFVNMKDAWLAGYNAAKRDLKRKGK